MADYQEYRRHVLHRRWRRIFTTFLALVLLVLLCGVWVLWRQLYPTPPSRSEPQATLLEQALPSAEWRTLSYTRQTSLTVQKLADGVTTAMDFRLASMPATEAQPVDLSFFDTAVFLGDSITQGMQIYDTGLPNAHYCAYRGVGPSAVVNGSTCKRVDGVEEVPLDALVSYAPQSVYILLGTNVLTQDRDYSSFLNYYGLMLDRIRELLPDADIYVQSITPVRPEVSADARHSGMYAERFIQVNNDLAALAVEKGCYFLDLWEVLADENGDLRAEYAQPDGYHLKPEGYTAWVDYLRTHVAHSRIVAPEETAETTEGAAASEAAAGLLPCLCCSAPGDALDLQPGPLGDGRHLHAAAGGIGLGERLGVHAVDGGKIVDVRQEDHRFDHMGHGQAGLGQDGPEVGQALGGLGLHRVGHPAGGGVHGQLARDEHQVPQVEGLAVRPDGGGRVGSGDHIHGKSSFLAGRRGRLRCVRSPAGSRLWTARSGSARSGRRRGSPCPA